MPDFSDVIVYVDESGNHGLDSSESVFPVFVLAFCVFRKSDYINQTVPAMQSFKFRHFGHDGVVLHEREIRKKLGPFSIPLFLNSCPHGRLYLRYNDQLAGLV